MLSIKYFFRCACTLKHSTFLSSTAHRLIMQSVIVPCAIKNGLRNACLVKLLDGPPRAIQIETEESRRIHGAGMRLAQYRVSVNSMKALWDALVNGVATGLLTADRCLVSHPIASGNRHCMTCPKPSLPHLSIDMKSACTLTRASFMSGRLPSSPVRLASTRSADRCR